MLERYLSNRDMNVWIVRAFIVGGGEVNQRQGYQGKSRILLVCEKEETADFKDPIVAVFWGEESSCDAQLSASDPVCC